MRRLLFFINFNSTKNLLAIFGIIVVALLFLSSLMIIGFRNQSAQATTCEGFTVDPCICKPADIMLVVDRSGSMAYPIEEEDKTKIAAAKEALNSPYCSGVSECVNDDGCCPITCNKDSDNDCVGFIDNLGVGDQVGLVSFSDGATLDNGLTFNKTEVKERVNALTPAGHTNMAGGIGVAYNELRDNARPGTVKVMIILGDGYPDRPYKEDDPDYPANTARAIATTAKNNGIRIITIGYNIPTESEAEYLMKEIASVPADYHAAPDSAALKTIYNNIKGSLCDCKGPDLTLSRIPANTIYPGDEITIISKADDNYGIGSHELEWTTNGWLSYDSHTCSPEGKTDTCSKNIGSFNSGTIDFRAKTEDTAGNKTNEDGACTYGSFSVATVTINSGDLIKQRENVVKVHISDPQGKADLNSFYLNVDSPALSETWKIDKGLMTCTGTGFELDCIYNVTPECSWGDSGRILVFPYDGVVGFHNLVAEKTINVNIIEEEGDMYCSDGIDNDCDGFIDDADPSCDSEIDTLFISRDPSGVVLNSDIVTLTSTAADASGIQNHKIKYQVNSGGWITAFDCWDTDSVDGKCDANLTKNISSFDVTIGPFNVGDFVEYKSEATDNNGYTGYTSTYSFTVQNAECYIGTTPINDVTVKCNGGAGRCCGGICDTSFSCSLDDECREEICSGTSWTCGPANEGTNCCDGLDCDGCYSYEDGCEERDYSCASGECVPSISNRHPDACDIILKYRFWDYGCQHIPFLGEHCILKNNIDCRLPNNWDGDGILCNCDCDDYDVEETISNGNCTDGKDNDCDSNIGGNDCGGGSCIDCEEPACDDEAPTTIITAYDKNGIKILPKEGGNVLDADTNKVSLNVQSVEVSPCPTSPNSLYQVKVFYNENDGPWNLIFTCTDADGDGQCDEDILKNIANFNTEIPVSGFSSGTKVGYKSEATDTAPIIPNTGDDEGYFIVIDIECAGENDLTSCTGGICCGQSCDTTQDCSLDIGCSKNACSGTSWICVPDNEGANCSKDGQSDGCYAYELGCEERNYSCTSGYCLYSLSNQNTDICSLSNLLDYACIGDGCDSNSIDCTQSGSIEGCACNCGGYGREEKFYNALSFDGVDDYVNINSINDDINISQGTVEVWIRAGSVDLWGDSKNHYIYSSSVNNNNQILLWKCSCNAIHCSYEAEGVYRYTSFYPVSEGWGTEWHHLVMTWDKDQDKLLAYVDGEEKQTKTGLKNWSGSINTSMIGSSSNGGRNWNGAIDEVRIYNRALSADEVAEHYRGEFINDTGLVGYWNFDEETGSAANDSSGNNNDGILKNGPVWISGADDSENVADPWRVCSDGKDNDCDGDFDLDGSNPEATCDNLAPTVVISAKDNQDNSIDDGAKVPDEYTDKITITSTTTENPIGLNTVKYHEVFYRIDEGTWNSVYRCDDVAPTDGKCDSDSSKNISSFSVEIGPFAPGVNIDYKSVATDTAIYPNTGSAQASFSVINYNIPPTVSVDPNSEIHPDYCKCGPGITVVWNFDDEDSGDSQSAYQIQIDDNSDFSTPEIDTEKIISSSNSYSTISGSLAYAKTYYWRVKVWDTKDDQSDWQDKDTEGNILQFSTPLHYWPTIDFTFSPENPERGIPVQFTNLSFYYKTDESSTVTGTFVQGSYNVSLEGAPQEVLDSTFAWDFDYCDYEGFTTESTEKDPTYYFLKPNSCLYSNTFTVALKVTDQDGYTCMATKNVIIGSGESKYPRWKEIAPE